MTNQDLGEEKLFDELENMYQQVAKSEESESDGKQMEALQNAYTSLQVTPDAYLQTINETYERLVIFWEAAQLSVDPSFREKAGRKLTEIIHAYEKILACRQKESGLLHAEPPVQTFKDSALSAPEVETTPHFPWVKILPGGAGIVIVVLAIFFWPTFYHYDSIQTGNITYQVRTNRITGNMTYFEGGKQVHPPAPAANPSIPPPFPAPQPPAQPTALSAEKPIPAPATKPGPAEGPKVTGKKEALFEKQAIQPVENKSYTIQVSAMRDLNIAREFMETQKKRVHEVYLATMEGKNRRVWHKVNLGRFTDKAEAARYMEERKIKEFFPHCFIQTVP